MSTPFTNTKTILEDERVALRPISMSDVGALLEAGNDDSVWKYFVFWLGDQSAMESFVNDAVADNDAGRALAFTVVDKATGRVAGSTRFGNISPRDHRVEIGWTWLGTQFHGSGINTHCKYLLLKFAFEQAKFKRVEFKTDQLNTGARKALSKVGAIEEGVLRSHTLMHDGRRRDTIFYSVLENEWPQVRQALEKHLS